MLGKVIIEAKILVVEDSVVMSKYIVKTLESVGYRNCVTAENGIEAINIIKKEKVDLLITDWLMPELDGLGLVNYVRNTLELKKLPIIMFTTKGEKDDIVTAMKSHINDFIIKPTSQMTIVEKVEQYLKKN